MFGKKRSSKTTNGQSGQPKVPMWDVPLFFGLMFLLSIAELVFTVDSFQYLEKTHSFQSSTEKARLGFLIFSSVRTIALSAVYIGFNFARKYFHSMFHTIFLVLSTIFWIVSGVLIRQMWGVINCNQGIGSIKGGLSECHELSIIEIIAWVLAVVSILATVPVVMNSMKRRKSQVRAKTHKTESSA